MKSTHREKSADGYRVGVILAAGLGSRLVGNYDYELKPLIQVDGISLLLRTLYNLEICCYKAVIVLGHGADTIQEVVLSRYRGSLVLDFVINDQYHLSNGVSVLAARNFIADEFILTMADHIMDAELFEIARDYHIAPESAALLVDYKLTSIYDMADATKTLVIGDKIVEIGKDLETYNCVDTGLFICTPVLLNCLLSIYRQKNDVSLSEGIQLLAADGKMYAVDIHEAFWQDVDTPEMLEHAKKILSTRKACSLLKN